MDYAGGPAGLTGGNVGTCPVCGWTGPGRDAPFHECDRSWLRGAATWVPDMADEEAQ